MTDGLAYYHLMSRTVNGEKWFGPREKERMRKIIRQVAGFSGVRVVTYAVMDNHFHVLVEVPPKKAPVSDAEIVRRYRILYPESTPWQPVSPEALEKLLREDGVEGKRLRQALLRRMHDVPWFAKTVKQRFASWFNRGRERFGPVFAERFKSVLIEADLKTLRTIAAYIDLNPVRAGKANDPKDYRFCGYAEAVAGGREARAGLAVLDRDLSGYRMTLFGSGAAAREGKQSIERKEAVRVLESEKGKLSLAEALRCRIRYFTDGVALGSPDFIEGIAAPINRERTYPARPNRLRGNVWGGLSALNGIRKDLFG
jgi:REP element-mobilizing transposase RayT